MKHIFLVFMGFSALASGLARLDAQTTSGKIIGQVTDPTGAFIQRAAVVATNTETHVQTPGVTDRSGHFEIPSLPIGTYTVQAAADGFATVVSRAYTLNINETQRVDFKLSLAGAQQSIDVAVNASQVDTVTSTVGGSVTERPLVDLPLDGRHILDLAQLQPGVTVGNNPGNTGAGSVSVSGGRTDSVNYLLDGGNNSMLLDNSASFVPDPDSVQEFRILESNGAAEYGRNGGGVISIVTKSGTSTPHGTAFEFLRNPTFNAQDFFQKRFGLPKDDLKRNQFGGTLGGEFFIPHLLPRHDKFFYFVSYQGQRSKDSMYAHTPTLTTQEVTTGDFSDADPDTQGAVAQFLQDNPAFASATQGTCQCTIDPASFDPVAKAYLSSGLIPFSPTGIFNTESPTVDNFDEFNGKFDIVFSQKDHLTVSLAHHRETITNPYGTSSAYVAGIPYPTNTTSKADVVNMDETHVFTPNLLNDARVVFQRLNTVQAVPVTNLPGGAALGVAITPDLTTGPPIMWMDLANTPYGFDYSGPTILVNNTYAYSDDLTWTHHSHTMKFGAYFSPFQNNQTFDFIGNGLFDFYGLNGVNAPGSDFAQFLIGQPDDFFQGPNAPSNIRSRQIAIYAQDQWHVTDRLTLNYGLRYEFATPKHDTQGRTFSPIPGVQSTRFPNAPMGLLFPGDAGAPTGVNFADKNDFAPRFGFAYDVGGKGSLVVRGGFGVFYDILKAEDNFQFNGQPPFFANVGDFNFSYPMGQTSPLGYLEDPYGSTGVTNPFPSKPPASNVNFNDLGANPFGGSQFFVDPHLRTPYVMQFNLGIEKSLGHDTIVNVTYVGSLSRKLTALQDINPYVPGSTVDQVYNLENGLPGMSGLTYTFMNTFKNVVDANYHGLQASLRKNTSHIQNIGTTYFTLGYTWAKSIDNASGFRQNNSVVPSYQPGLTRSVSDFDVKQRIVFSGGWDLPFDDFFPSALRALTHGWSLYPIASYQSGYPVDISDQLSQDGSPGPTGFGDNEIVRVNLVGNSVKKFNPYSSVAAGGGAPYVSSDNFDPNVTAGYGTLPRNSFFGPGTTNVDLSFAKLTPLTGGSNPLSLELRGDFFNVFNITQFSNPVTSIGSSQFGQIIQTAHAPRVIQLAGKLRF